MTDKRINLGMDGQVQEREMIKDNSYYGTIFTGAQTKLRSAEN